MPKTLIGARHATTSEAFPSESLHEHGVVALSLERNTTRRDTAQAVANSQRPEVHGTPEAFLVETD